jgi:hypothetical protein
MFQAVTLWKLWLLFATVTLVILSTVDLAKTSGQEKDMREAQLGINALCRQTSLPPISAQ